MDYRLSLPVLFPDNPIMAAEQAYQQRTARPQRRWLYWLLRLGMYVGLLLSLILFGGLLIAALTGRDPTPIVTRLGAAPSLLAAVVPLWQVGLMLKTLQLSANSIAREKEAQTWELLILSGIDARRIVRGKWWATVQRQWRAYAWLGLLRLGAVTLTGYSSVRLSSYYLDMNTHLPHVASILLGGVAVFALTMAGLGFSAACGVMGSAVSGRGAIAIVRAIANQIVLTVGTVIAGALLVTFIFDARRYYFQSDWFSALMGTGITLLDNGSILASSLMSIWSPVSQVGLVSRSEPLPIIAVDLAVAVVLSIAAYGVLTWLALRLAERRAVSQMALPVQKRREATPAPSTPVPDNVPSP